MKNKVTQNDINNLLDILFEKKFYGHPYLYNHLFSSYEDFLYKMIPSYVKENVLFKEIKIDKTEIYKIQIDNLKYMKPTDELNKKFVTPQICRNRNLSYNVTIKGDIRIIQDIYIDNMIKETNILSESKDFTIAKAPCMVKSRLCNLYHHDDNNSCPGGYFIVNGNEKCIVSIERTAWNQLIYSKKDKSVYAVTIYSQKDDLSSIHPLSILIDMKSNKLFISSSIFSVEIPVFVLLSFINKIPDKDIISIFTNDGDMFFVKKYIEYNISLYHHIKDTNDLVEYMFNKLSAYIRNKYHDQELTIEQKRVIIEESLKFKILPHLENEKKFFNIILMIRKLFINIEYNDKIFNDRDDYNNKRFDTPGVLLGQLFKQAFSKQCSDINKHILKNNGNSIHISNLYKSVYITQYIKNSMMTGNWGISKKRKGVSRMYDRLSYFKSVCALRQITVSQGDEAASRKNVNMRHVHTSQCGFICSAETPEGEKVGLIKSLSLSSTISNIDVETTSIVKRMIHNIYSEHFRELYQVFDIKNYYLIIINGEMYGYITCEKADVMYESIKDLKFNKKINYQTSIIIDPYSQEIIINNDVGRLIRPLLSIDNFDIFYNASQIDKTNINFNFELFMDKCSKAVEFIDTLEQQFTCIAPKIEDIYNEKKKLMETNKNIYKCSVVNYNYLEFHPSMHLSLACSTIPFLNRNQSPRIMYHSQQLKQSIGIYNKLHHKRFDLANILYNPEIPLVAPRSNKYLHLDEIPYGKNTIVAIMPFAGFNQEDSMILNKSSVERGMYSAITYHVFSSIIEKNHNTSIDDVFSKPEEESKLSNMRNFDIIAEDGSPILESVVSYNDVIISKLAPINTNNGDVIYKDKTTLYKKETEGIIDSVQNEITNDGYPCKKVRVRIKRKPIIGDKFTSRHGQKATVGLLMEESKMPFNEFGVTPDIIINPNALPSRMTIGQLWEMFFAKLATIIGKRLDGTGFEEFDFKKIQETYDLKDGTEILYDPIQGTKLKANIFMAPCYYIRLKQLVKDKIHARAEGSMNILTRQPNHGRKYGGGLRLGEMERDVIIAHGSSYFLNERFMKCCDQYKIHVCDICGNIAAKMKQLKYYWCKKCTNFTHISSIEIPYAFKLMIQELESINIKIHLRTENYYN